MVIQPRKVQIASGVEYTIRSATAHDAAAMLSHLLKTHEESYRNLNQSAEYWRSVSVEAEEQILTSTANSPSSFLLIALHEDLIVGGIGIMGETQEFVRKNARVGMSIQAAHGGRGLGKQLVQYAIEKAVEAGLHRLELNVRTYNQAGIALYEKFGFRKVGVLRDAAFIDGAYVDEYKYELILGSL